MECAKCGTEVPVKDASDGWTVYCAKCGLEEALKEIKQA